MDQDDVQFSSGAKIEHHQGEDIDDMKGASDDSGIKDDGTGLSQGSDRSLEISELGDNENDATGCLD